MNKNFIKKLLTIGLCFAFSFTLFCACKVNSGNDDGSQPKADTETFELANTTIENFETFSALGVSEYEPTVSTSANVAYAETSTKKLKLVGIINDVIQELKFIYENKEQANQSWNVTAFFAFKNFTLVEYSKNSDAFNQYKFSITNTKTEKQYLIDNSTGKIYSLSTADTEKGLCFDISTDSYFYGLDGFESDTALFLPITGSSEKAVYKFEIENNSLKISELIKGSQFDFNAKTMFVDKYGNLFLAPYLNGGGSSDSGSSGLPSSGISDNGNSTGLNASSQDYSGTFANGCVITTNKTLKSLDGETFMLQNRKVVSGNDLNGYKIFDENGNTTAIDESEFYYRSLPDREYLEQSSLVKKTGSVEYYTGKTYKNIFKVQEYANSGIGVPTNEVGGVRYGYVYKLTWVSENKYTVQAFDIGKLGDEFSFYTPIQAVATDSGIYFRLAAKIVFFDFATDSETVVSSSYIFNSLYSDNLGNIRFIALNENMQTVSGVIKADGTIDTTVSEGSYKILYIAPLN